MSINNCFIFQNWLDPGTHSENIKWDHFPRYWPFVLGIQWRGALMLSLICAWTNGWVNNRGVSDSRRHRAHYGVTVMSFYDAIFQDTAGIQVGLIMTTCDAIKVEVGVITTLGFRYRHICIYQMIIGNNGKFTNDDDKYVAFNTHPISPVILSPQPVWTSHKKHILFMISKKNHRRGCS